MKAFLSSKPKILTLVLAGEEKHNIWVLHDYDKYDCLYIGILAKAQAKSLNI